MLVLNVILIGYPISQTVREICQSVKEKVWDRLLREVTISLRKYSRICKKKISKIVSVTCNPTANN